MNLKTNIVKVTSENISDHPQAICFINPKHEFYHQKVGWLQEQFQHGLKIKLVYLEGEKRPTGFIEYVPGEFCWRSINANGYLFIHCLWTNGKKYQHQGLGSLLIREAEKDAGGLPGIAAMTSDESFMAGKELFIKNGYEIVSESGADQLLAKKFKEGPLPCFNNWQDESRKYDKLTIIYSKQCPWVARFMEEVKPVLLKENLHPTIIELKNAQEAQHAPSLYSAFTLIYRGKILADRYISTTRFRNIIKKEI